MSGPIRPNRTLTGEEFHAGAGRGDGGRQELRVLRARAGGILSPPAPGYPVLRAPLRRGGRLFRSGGRAISARAAERARDSRSPTSPRPLQPQAGRRRLEALPAEPLARSRIRERDLPRSRRLGAGPPGPSVVARARARRGPH